MRFPFFLLSSFFTCALCAPSSSAETISVNYAGLNPGYTSGDMYYDNDGAGGNSAKIITGPVGIYHWAPKAGSNNIAPFNSLFKSFCIDLDQTVPMTATFTINKLTEGPVSNGPGAYGSGSGGTFMTALQADFLRELWGENFATLETGTASQQKMKSTAFQLAVWEILFESKSTKDLNAGYLKVHYSGSTPSFINQANQYLASTYDTGYSAYERGLVALTSPTGQDYVTVIPIVPLPTAAVAGTALIAGIGVAKKMRAVA